MKKIYVVVQKKDIVPALESLRGLGSIHVEHQEPLTGFQLEERRGEVEILENAIAVLHAVKVKGEIGQIEAADWTETVNTVLGLSAQAERYKESVAKRQVLINRWEPWGHFDLQAVREMAERGIYIQLCAVPRDQRKAAPRGVALETVYSSGGMDRCVAISREPVDLPFEKIALPEKSLKEMTDLQREEQSKIGRAEENIEAQLCYLNSLQKILVERRNVLSFEEVERGMREDEVLAVLKGYCPADACKATAKKAKEERWGILFEDPSEGDQVPTLLKNPAWIEMIKPIFGMINIVPGYKEFDISFLFLMFFSIFVGILIGDAGYAVVYALFFRFALPRFIPNKPEQKTFYALMYLLCGCTFIWGVLTGTYFGQQWLPSYVRPLVPWLRDNYNIQVLCFMIGAVHLSLAHLWRALAKLPSVSFLADVGWLVVIWGMYGWARSLVLGDPAPGFLLLMVGSAMVVLFTRPNINPLKAVGPGLGNLLLNVINSFTDIVSYIRLFAVGLATVAVADAANSMSLFWIFFLHTLNILLAAMAILVHGLRLNVLEFSGHLSMEWAGFQYSPFKKINETQPYGTK